MTKLRCTLLALAMIASVGAAGAQTRQFQTAFRIDPNASAEAVYADLSRTAREACAKPGLRAIQRNAAERACAADLLDRAVKAANRKDLASLHDAQVHVRAAG